MKLRGMQMERTEKRGKVKPIFEWRKNLYRVMLVFPASYLGRSSRVSGIQVRWQRVWDTNTGNSIIYSPKINVLIKLNKPFNEKKKKPSLTNLTVPSQKRQGTQRGAWHVVLSRTSLSAFNAHTQSRTFGIRHISFSAFLIGRRHFYF